MDASGVETARLELRVRRDADGVRVALLAPEVGLFTQAAAPGTVLVAGEDAGALLALGRSVRLVVPGGVQGRVSGATRERVQAPVAYGDVLYELEPLAADDARRASATTEPASTANALVLRAPQSGRFYHRAAPGEPAFVETGARVGDGQPIGLIEVMKTFTHVVYRAGGALPPHARVARVAVADGGEVRAGDVLLELERE